MSKQTRAAIAEMRASLGGVTEKPVDVKPWIAAVVAVFEADEAGRPYSMIPREAKPLSPAGERMMARYSAMGKALAKEGGAK